MIRVTAARNGSGRCCVIWPSGLAKRHGDTRLSHYRDVGVPATRVVALLSRWCGIGGLGDAAAASELLGRFDMGALPRDAVAFTADDDAWLLTGAGSAATPAGAR